MLRRRFPLGLVAPIALVILVTALGALQYRWVGQVSERERDQLRQSLDRRAREFADDFDREIGRAYQVFEPEAGFDPAAPTALRNTTMSGSRTPFAGLVKTTYFAQAAHDDYTLYEYRPADRRFEAVPWPRSSRRFVRGSPRHPARASARSRRRPASSPSGRPRSCRACRPSSSPKRAATSSHSRRPAASSRPMVRSACGSPRASPETTPSSRSTSRTLRPPCCPRWSNGTFRNRAPIGSASACRPARTNVLAGTGRGTDDRSGVSRRPGQLLRSARRSFQEHGGRGAGHHGRGDAADQVAAVRRKEVEAQAQRQHMTPVPKNTLVLTAPPLSRLLPDPRAVSCSTSRARRPRSAWARRDGPCCCSTKPDRSTRRWRWRADGIFS